MLISLLLMILTNTAEDQLDTTNYEWSEKVREMKAQLFADECLLTELKWQKGAMKD